MKTEIIAITDRSGSMASIMNDVIGGYNTFLKEQKEQPGEARMTYTQFDSEYEVVYSGKPLSDAPPLTHATFVPRGSTALAGSPSLPPLPSRCCGTKSGCA